MNKARTPQPESPLSWRQRLNALRDLPRFFGLVWRTSPGLMALNVVLRVARSAIPVSVLYIGKLIIDQVVFLTRGGAASVGAVGAHVARHGGVPAGGHGILGMGSPDGMHFLWQ